MKSVTSKGKNGELKSGRQNKTLCQLFSTRSETHGYNLQHKGAERKKKLFANSLYYSLAVGLVFFRLKQHCIEARVK